MEDIRSVASECVHSFIRHEAIKGLSRSGQADLQSQLGFTGSPGSQHIVRVQVAGGGLCHGATPPGGGDADAGAPHGST